MRLLPRSVSFYGAAAVGAYPLDMSQYSSPNPDPNPNPNPDPDPNPSPDPDPNPSPNPNQARLHLATRALRDALRTAHLRFLP